MVPVKTMVCKDGTLKDSEDEIIVNFFILSHFPSFRVVIQRLADAEIEDFKFRNHLKF